MKQFLPVIALLGLTLSCAPPNKVKQTDGVVNPIKKEKTIHIDKQIAPGTCSIILTNCEIISENSNSMLTGTLNTIKAYGAGFNHTLEKGKDIKISISKEQASKLNSVKALTCIISSIDSLKKKDLLQLVDYKLPIKE